MTSWRGYDLLSILTKCGQRDNLQLCLDAGDINSYSGSGQSWLDRSGGGYDFFRGATSGAAADDPTFNGTAGQLSDGEYWSFDGGDFFTYDSANETWMNNLHKNNAKLTLASWVWVPSAQFSTDSVQLFSTCGTATTTIGVHLRVESANFVRFRAGNGSGSAWALEVENNTSYTLADWTFFAASIDEAADFAAVQTNNSVQTSSGTYSSPSSSAAAGTLTLARSAPAATDFFINTGRMAMAMAWEGRALSEGELKAIYMATRARFGV
jgi:hypothetical protein